jgi:hypothetical protein
MKSIAMVDSKNMKIKNPLIAMVGATIRSLRRGHSNKRSYEA